jgi:hypothetical protein
MPKKGERSEGLDPIIVTIVNPKALIVPRECIATQDTAIEGSTLVAKIQHSL